MAVSWWFVGVVVGALSADFTGVFLLGPVATVIPLTLVQRSINSLNEPSRMNSGYSAVNITAIVAGFIVWCLVAIRTYSKLSEGPMLVR